MSGAPLGFEATYRALDESVVALASVRDVVVVAGPDARSYLQGQLSQDLDALVPGDAVDSMLLSPQGMLDALVRVSLLEESTVVLDVDAGFGPVVEERLRRFKLRVKATLEGARWELVSIRGPGAAEPSAPAGGLSLAVHAPGFSGVDLLAEAVPWPAGVPVGDPAAFSGARIEAGVLTMGAEVHERTIPQETGLVESTVSFTKGCYTGQELVARIDSRGNRVPRRLRGVVGEAGGSFEVGDVVEREGAELGTLTSVGFSARLGAPVALAYLRRELEPPAAVEVVGSGVRLSGRARALPLFGSD